MIQNEIFYLINSRHRKSIKPLLNYFSLGKSKALQEITDTRIATPPHCDANMTNLGDLEEGILEKYEKEISPILNIQINSRDYQASWDYTNYLEEMYPKQIPSKFKKRQELDRVDLSIKASSLSFRRFDAKLDNHLYSLRTHSFGHPPRERLLLIYGHRHVMSVPYSVEERETARSLVMHDFLSKNGIPFLEEPIGLLELKTDKAFKLYNGSLQIEPNTPLFVSVTRKNTQDSIRLSHLTPSSLEEISQSANSGKRKYFERLLEGVGTLLYKVHNLNGATFQLSYAVNSEMYKQFFDGEFEENDITAGESNLHNIEINRQNGEFGLVGDFSNAFPITCDDGPEYLDSQNIPYNVKVWEVSQGEIEKAKNSDIISMVFFATHNIPFLRTLYSTNMISENEYREHKTLVDEFNIISNSRDTNPVEKRLEDAKLEFLNCIYDLQPYMNTLPNYDNKIILKNKMKGIKIDSNLQKLLDKYFTAMDNVIKTGRRRNRSKRLSKLNEISEKISENIRESPITQTIFDAVYEGYKPSS
jgi:hypothetical protein